MNSLINSVFNTGLGLPSRYMGKCITGMRTIHSTVFIPTMPVCHLKVMCAFSFFLFFICLLTRTTTSHHWHTTLTTTTWRHSLQWWSLPSILSLSCNTILAWRWMNKDRDTFASRVLGTFPFSTLPWLPMGLNYPTDSEFNFSYFIFLHCLVF